DSISAAVRLIPPSLRGAERPSLPAARTETRAGQSIYSPHLRAMTGSRAAAWVLVATGAALPPLRRRARIPRGVVLAGSGLAPLALVVAMPRSRTRDAGVVMLNMWA